MAWRWTFYIGGDGRDPAIDRKVSPPTAGEDVVKQLDEQLDLRAHRANLDWTPFVPQRRAPDRDAGPETRFAYRLAG
jgi:hypothetical protein